MRLSDRATRLPTYAVSALAERKRVLIAQGVDVIDLGAGDADIAAPELARQALHEATAERRMSRYAFQQGLVEFREAVARFMLRRFAVSVDPMTELLPLIGSKEGLAHLPFAFADPGDVCVIPEPGYPAYRGGAVLAGTEVELVPLRAESNFLVELDDLPRDVLRRTRVVYLNYPNNPTGAIAPEEYLTRTVEVCRRHQIILAFDNPYSELTYDGYVAPSILQIPGAEEVAVEFHSFSKSFGMTGWRLGWVVGNPTVIAGLSKVKSYLDTGAFLAIQQAGRVVIDRAEELVAPVREMFRVRRDALVQAVSQAGFACRPPRGALYLWVPLPEGIASASFARDLLEEEGLVVLAGGFFGDGGEGYMRLSFIAEPDRLREGAARMGKVLKQLGEAGART